MGKGNPRLLDASSLFLFFLLFLIRAVFSCIPSTRPFLAQDNSPEGKQISFPSVSRLLSEGGWATRVVFCSILLRDGPPFFPQRCMSSGNPRRADVGAAILCPRQGCHCLDSSSLRIALPDKSLHPRSTLEGPGCSRTKILTFEQPVAEKFMLLGQNSLEPPVIIKCAFTKLFSLQNYSQRGKKQNKLTRKTTCIILGFVSFTLRDGRTWRRGSGSLIWLCWLRNEPKA